MKLIRLLSLIILAIMLSGCFIRPYKFDIHQGNDFTPQKIAEVHVGMSEAQVHYLLGSPLIHDGFHANRWDYLHYEKPGYKKATEHHSTLYFSEGKVTRII